MKWNSFLVACALLMTLLLFAQRRQPLPARSEFRAAIDLTHDLSEKSPNWEGTEKSPFEAKALGVIEKDGYFSRTISLPEHFSTHLDAPAHFAAGAWTVEQIPPDRLIAPLAVLDVSKKVAANSEYEVSLEDVAAWEQEHGHVPPGAVVIARTGWSDRWNSMKRYRNADDKGMHFPGFSEQAVKFLVDARQISGLGIDTLSVDPGASKTYPVHHYVAAHNVYNLENVSDLGQVPASGAILVVAPAKLAGGSGAPVRLFALLH
jgi:kynurenine formamidase